MITRTPPPASLRLEGPRLYLRPVRISDVTAAYVRWLNDPGVNQYLESRFTVHSLEDVRVYVAKVAKDPNYAFFAMVLRTSDRHIGNIKLGPINWQNRRGDIGLMIGEKDCWGQGYATESIQLLVRYAFEDLKLHKLTAGCYKANRGTPRAFAKAGFEVEGTRKSQYWCEGGYMDEILLGLVNPAEDSA